MKQFITIGFGCAGLLLGCTSESGGTESSDISQARSATGACSQSCGDDQAPSCKAKVTKRACTAALFSTRCTGELTYASGVDCEGNPEADAKPSAPTSANREASGACVANYDCQDLPASQCTRMVMLRGAEGTRSYPNPTFTPNTTCAASGPRSPAPKQPDGTE